MAGPQPAQDERRSTEATPGSSAARAKGARGSGLGTTGAAVILVVTLVVLGGIFVSLEPLAKWVLELNSVVLLIAGFVTVTLILYLGTILMTALGMRTPGEALGMPPGSIRALIAMVLILIFAIIGVVVLQQSSVHDVYTSTGVTQTQIDAIRAGGGTVLQQDLIAPEPGASPGDAIYTVKIRPAVTPEEHDFALQLLTTVSTLVVAVAGFYFGSRNVEAADRSTRAARGTGRQAPEGESANDGG
jgi:preprotein translocase subunit SecG